MKNLSRIGNIVFAFIFLGMFRVDALQSRAVGSTQNPSAATKSSTPDPCIKPAPMFPIEEYNGPLKKIVWYITRKPEIKTVPGHRLPGQRICPLNPGEKFHLFVRNTIEPVNFMANAFDAGIQQAQDVDPTFGQGAAGYGKRYAAGMADRASSDFFHTFLFPVVFRQDPRYYRLGEGNSGRQRFAHALTHVFVAQSDSGGQMFNFSEWLGTASAKALSNTYHPGNSRGVGPAAARIATSVGSDIGFDVLREFWPEVVRKLRLPFRTDAQISPQPPSR